MIDISSISESVPKSDAEYIGQDGLLHCKKCSDPVELIIPVPNVGMRKVRCICTCIKESKALEEQRQKQEQLDRNRRICFSGSKLMGCTFENSNESEYLTMGKNYAKHFTKFIKSGKGLLLYGTVGTGKSHIASCIANELIDKGYKVLMTNFATIINALQSSFEGRQEYIDSLNRYSLLILDDLGAERQSEYMQEQVFNIIDSRYKSGLPMIITTNLTSEELKKPSDMGNIRIYDRILERCHPVEVKGQSIRRQNLKSDFMEMRKILNG